jgi:hypothetical protein
LSSGDAGRRGERGIRAGGALAEKFEQLEWLLAATSRVRSAIDLLTFVYRDPGDFGDDRVYVLRRPAARRSRTGWSVAHGFN